ncbi:MAG: gliding motility-associated C-terminal domain-containing protein [Chitinophagales bacterium]
MSSLYKRFPNLCRAALSKFSITSILMVVMLFSYNQSQAQSVLYESVSINLERVTWNLYCADGTDVGLGCVTVSGGPDPRFRFRVGTDGSFSSYRHLGNAVGPQGGVLTLNDVSDTDGRNVSNSNYNVTFTNLCADYFSLNLQAWEEDQAIAGVGLCPESVDYLYNSSAVGGCNAVQGGDDSEASYNVNTASNIPNAASGNYTQTFNFGAYSMRFAFAYNKQDAPTVTPSSPQACVGGSITLTSSAPRGPGNNIEWFTNSSNPSGSSLGFGTSKTISSIPFLPYTVYAAETRSGCYGDIRTITITQASIPSTPSANGAQTCLGGSVTLSVNPVVPGVTYSWYDESPLGSGILVGVGPNFTTPPINVASEDWYVTASSGVGCESAARQVVVNTNLPLVAPIASSETICEGYKITLSAASGGPNSGFFSWYADAGLTNLVYVGNPFTTPNLSSSTTYYVTEDINDCETAATAVNVTVTPRPGTPVPDDDTLYTTIGGSVTYSVSTPPGPNEVYRWYADNPILGGPVLFEGSSWTTPPIMVPIEDFYVTLTDTTVDCTNGSLKIDGSGLRAINSNGVRVVAVAANLIAPPVVENDTICEGDVAVLTATADSVGAVIVWFSSGSPVDSIATGNTYTTPVLAQTTTFYAGEYINGELVSELAAATAVVNSKPATPQGPSDIIICDLLLTINAVNVSSANVGDNANFIVIQESTGDTVQNVTLLISDETLDLTWGGQTPPDFIDGSYTIVVTVIDNVTNCVSDPLIIDLNVLPLPSAPSVSGDTIVCSGESTVITAAGTGGFITWYDDAGLTNVISTGSQLNTGAITSATTYWVTETKTTVDGCESEATVVNITVDALPTAPTAINDTICQGDVATLSATGSGGTLVWYSDASGADSVGTGTAFTTGALYQTTTYYVGEENASGCASVLTPVRAVVNPKPTPPNAPTQVTQCILQPVFLNFLDEQIGNFLHFIAIDDATGDTIANFNEPIFALSQDIVGIFPTANEQTIVLSVIDAVTGCESDVSIMNVSIIDPPIAPTVTGDTTICANEATVLTAAGTGGLITWYSDATLSTVISTGSQLNTGSLSGDTTFFVTETNVDVTTCESEFTAVVVSVTSLPAGPTVTNDTICEGETATLLAAGSGGTLIWYSDASGNDSIGTGTSYTTTALTQTTTYYVGEVNPAAECASELVAVLAVVNPKPTPPEFVAPSFVCEGLVFPSFYFNDEQFGDIWNVILIDPVGDTIASASGTITELSNDFFTNVSPGIHIIIGSVTDATTGCVSDVTIGTLTVVGLPSAPTVNGDTTLCVGESTILTATGTGGTITWYSDAGLTNVVAVDVQFVTPVLTANTTYYVTESNDSTQGCEGLATVVNITVNALPDAPTTTNDTICIGETATLLANGTGGTLVWFSDPSGADSVGTGSSFTTPALTQTTTYYVGEINAEGCLGGLSPATAVVNPNPEPPTMAAELEACEGSELIFNITVNPDLVGGTITNILIDALGDTVLNLERPITATVIETDLTPLNLIVGVYTHYAFVNDGDCNSPIVTQSITINPVPDAPIVLDTVEVCAGETATLFAYGQVANPNSIITWYDNVNFDPLATGWEYETQPLSADKVYFATITDENGCESEASTITVLVNELPANPVGMNDTVCQWSTATLSATGNGGLLTWYSDGAGTNVLGTGGSYTTQALAQTTVFYVGETNTTTGCESNLVAVTAVVTPGPDAPQAGNITLCVNETGELTATGSGTGSLIWYDANQVQIEVDAMPPANGSLAVGPFAIPGTYFFYVSESDGNCESQLEEIEVVVGDAVIAPIAQGDTICEGETATITAVGTGGVINWYADGALTIPVSSGSQYTTGVLTVTTSFWATESYGSCESPAVEVEVVVNPLPATPIAGSNSPICEGATLQLTASDAFGATYTWTGPNGFTSSLQNPTIDNVTEADHQGVYSVTVTSNSSGCVSGTATVNVDIVPIPDAPSIASNSPLCEGEDLILTASAVDGATYTWYDGSNNIITTTVDNSLTIPTVTLADAGTYGVSVNVSGCESPTNTTVVVVKPRPDAPAVSNNSPICEYETLSLIAQVVSGATYTWTGPNGPIAQNGPIVTIPNATAANSGTYGVFITVNGCSSDTATTEVVVTPAPVLSQNPTTNSPICEHDMLILEAPYDANLTYNWTGPNGYVADSTFIDTVNNFYVEVVFDANENDHQGFYTLVVTDNTTGCDSKAYPVLVIVNKFPDNVIADNNGPACEGDEVQLTVTSIVNATYTWTGPLNYVSYEQNPVLENVTPDMSGTYEVTIMLGGCTSMTVSTDVLIRANPIADAGVDLYIEEGTIFQLDGNGSIGAIDFAWLGEDQSYFDNPTSPNPWIGLNGPLPARDEPYVFVLTVYNQFGCTDMDTVLVYIYETTDLIIPNVITPNGDGVNDAWVVTYLNNLDNYVLSIYARGGTLVLKTSSYNNDWYGTNVDGDDLPEGTYWYTIRSDDELVFKGYIEILR